MHVNYIGSLNPYKNPARGPSVLFCLNGEIGSERPSDTSKITQLVRCRDRVQVHILCVWEGVPKITQLVRYRDRVQVHILCVCVWGGPKPPNAMCSLHYPCLLSRRPEAHLFPEAWEQVAWYLPAGPGPEWSPQDSDALSPCSDLGQVF